MSKNRISHPPEEKLNPFEQVQNKLPKSTILKGGIIVLSIPLTIIGLSIGVVLALAIVALIIAVLTIVVAATLIASPFLWIKNGFSLKNINPPRFSSLQTESNEQTSLLDSSRSIFNKHAAHYCNFFKKSSTEKVLNPDQLNKYYKLD